MNSTLWTQRRFAGLALLLGSIVFLTAAGLTPRDAPGTYVYALPTLREQVLLIFQQQQLWQWSMLLFMGGIVVTFLGFVLFTTVLRDGGEQAFSQLGLLASLLGVLLLIFLAFDLSVQPWAGQEIAKTGVIPDVYMPFDLWATALFHIYTFFAFSALALYGGAVLSSRALPRWIGWLAIVYALAGLGLFAYAHDVPPFLHYLLPLVIGILLLLPRSQVSRGSRREEEATLASRMIVSER